MIHEQEFICWHANQDEADGKEVKATTIRSAAKKAVDIWRHENLQELEGDKVTVFVRDEARRRHQVVVSREGQHKSPDQAPEAFI
jgi:hypothetical protein